jgi:predicted amidohydrolase
MKIAAVQMVSATDTERNLEAADRLIAQAAGAGAELVALPEYFCRRADPALPRRHRAPARAVAGRRHHPDGRARP